VSDELDSYLPDLRRFAMSLTHCSDLAEEIVQESLLRALQRDSTLPPVRQLRPWLFQIAANVCKERWRREARRSEFEMTALQRHPQTSAATPVDIVGHREHLDRIWQFVQTLPETQRHVLLLNVWEQLTNSEIAERIGISLGSVKSSLSIARSKLREHFYPESADHE
jgi:RNA polymerase sigma-70 factor (ECF subfamily)